MHRTYQSGAAKRRKATEEKHMISKLPKLAKYFLSPTIQESAAPIPTDSDKELQLPPSPVAQEDATPSNSTDTAVPIVFRRDCEELQQPQTGDLQETHQTVTPISNDSANLIALSGLIQRVTRYSETLTLVLLTNSAREWINLVVDIIRKWQLFRITDIVKIYLLQLDCFKELPFPKQLSNVVKNCDNMPRLDPRR
ncbi:hypothetical protein RN001_011518 [Aquatica leii]|uniref:Uncharacterized protein n=1 Tax=Aquatica leii TaxID=1421715 RepID=A0AAN7P4D0_9COLE|nr:hypothetical protein RN001_011518 [Aquatica leii]